MSWQNRTYLITGATGDTGSVISRALAERGAQLVLLGRRKRRLEALDDALADTGAEVWLQPFDVAGAGPDDYQNLSAELKRQFGKLDGVLNIAAHFPGLTPLANRDPQELLKTLHINLGATLLLMQALGPLLAGGRWLQWINDPDRTCRAYWGSYGAAQSALLGLCQQMTDEWESQGTQVTPIRPEKLLTKLTRQAEPSLASGSLPTPDHLIAPVLKALS